MTHNRLRAAFVALLFLTLPAFALGPSNVVELKVLEWMTKQEAFGTAPSALWYSLHSADPGDTCANELASTGSYARAQLDPDAASGTNTNYNAVSQASSASSVTNKLAITFPTASAAWNSSSAIPYFCVHDASTSGTCLWCGQIAGGTGIVVLSGTTAKFDAGTPGQLSLTLD